MERLKGLLKVFLHTHISKTSVNFVFPFGNCILQEAEGDYRAAEKIYREIIEKDGSNLVLQFFFHSCPLYFF